MPIRAFSIASSYVSASWSLVMPAQRYPARSLPVIPGQCPSARFPRNRASSIMSSFSGSAASTPGKSITSPSPMTPSWYSSCATVGASSTAPDVSRLLDGTQDGIMTKTLDGRSSISPKTSSIPCLPRTFAISCGSMIIPVVPCLIAAPAKLVRVNMLDS